MRKQWSRRSLALVALLTLACRAAHAQGPQFLAIRMIEPAKLLPAPPLEDSPETRAELDLILRLQEARSPQEVARIRAEAKLTPQAFQNALWACHPALRAPPLLVRIRAFPPPGSTVFP